MRSVARVLAVVLSIAVLTGCESEPTPTPVPPKPTAVVSKEALPLPVPTVPPAVLAPVATPTPAVEPGFRRGGILRAVSTSSYVTLDPQLAPGQRLDGYGLLYNHLLSYSLADAKAGKFEVKPELAESFERTDPTTYVFKLHKGIKLHDGSEWNAEVARWNLDRLLTHPKSLSRAVLGAIKSVDVVDASTIKVNLSSPDAALPVLLTRGAATGSAMISKAAVEKLGDDGFAAKGVGTGPMELVLWRRDDQLVLKKWDGYWEKGADGKTLPYLDGYIERYVADPAAALVEVKTGNAHLIDNVRAEDVAGVKADPKLVYWELGWAGPAYFFAGLDATKGPFQNPKLRQAALYAVDREALAKALGQGLARPDYYPFWQPALLGYDEALPSYKYDLAKAKQLVSESGYNNSVEITMSTIAGQPEQRIGELVQEMWGRAGMRVRLDAMEGLAFYTRAATGSFDAGFIREPTLAVDPDLLAERMTKGSVANVFNYNNPALDSCMMEGRGEYDAAKRSEIYKRCQRVIYEDATISSGYRIPENRVFSKAMKGLSLQFLSDDLRGVWLEDR